MKLLKGMKDLKINSRKKTVCYIHTGAIDCLLPVLKNLMIYIRFLGIYLKNSCKKSCVSISPRKIANH
jgi:hypothetical protein